MIIVFLCLCDDKYFTFRPLMQKRERKKMKVFQPTYSSFKLYKFIFLPLLSTFSPPQAIVGILLFQGVYLWFISITLNIDNTKNTWHLFSVEM